MPNSVTTVWHIREFPIRGHAAVHISEQVSLYLLHLVSVSCFIGNHRPHRRLLNVFQNGFFHQLPSCISSNSFWISGLTWCALAARWSKWSPRTPSPASTVKRSRVRKFPSFWLGSVAAFRLPNNGDARNFHLRTTAQEVWDRSPPVGSRGEAPCRKSGEQSPQKLKQFGDTLYRFWLHAETIKILKFHTNHLLILEFDQYASGWGRG